jgi:hypothetical protein
MDRIGATGGEKMLDKAANVAIMFRSSPEWPRARRSFGPEDDHAEHDHLGGERRLDGTISTRYGAK